MSRFSRSISRPLPRGEFDAALRDLRRERGVSRTAEEREAWKQQQIERALQRSKTTSIKY